MKAKLNQVKVHTSEAAQSLLFASQIMGDCGFPESAVVLNNQAMDLLKTAATIEVVVEQLKQQQSALN